MEGCLWRSTLPDSDVPVILIEQPDYFERDDAGAGRGLYQATQPNGQRIDYADNCERFGFFGRAILEAMRLLDFWPALLHLNDWQTGLAGVYLREIYAKNADRNLANYEQIRTIFTIHNIAYQGLFWHLDMPLLGLPWRLFHADKLEFFGKINFLKAGIVYADRITVSPTDGEIRRPFGYGLDGVLMQRREQLHGIVNGIDEHVWNPVLIPPWRANMTLIRSAWGSRVQGGTAGGVSIRAAVRARLGDRLPAGGAKKASISSRRLCRCFFSSGACNWRCWATATRSIAISC